MKKIVKIAISTFGVLALLSGAESAKAEVYSFNRFIGKVYIKNVDVDFSDSGVNLSTEIHTPACANQYHIEGYVQVTYKNNGGVASRRWNFSGSDEEDKDMRYADFVAYRQSKGGRVSIETQANCVYHGIQRGGVRLPF